MDGRGRWMDNVFIERLWRSLKYKCVYLHAFETGSELRWSPSFGQFGGLAEVGSGLSHAASLMSCGALP